METSNNPLLRPRTDMRRKLRRTCFRSESQLACQKKFHHMIALAHKYVKSIQYTIFIAPFMSFLKVSSYFHSLRLVLWKRCVCSILSLQSVRKTFLWPWTVPPGYSWIHSRFDNHLQGNLRMVRTNTRLFLRFMTQRENPFSVEIRGFPPTDRFVSKETALLRR